MNQLQGTVSPLEDLQIDCRPTASGGTPPRWKRGTFKVVSDSRTSHGQVVKTPNTLLSLVDAVLPEMVVDILWHATPSASK